MLNLKYYQALNRAIHDEMVADESVVLLGEDVGESGGIFGQTKGLFDPLEVFGSGTRLLRKTDLYRPQ